ncbi:LicD family protein [Breznakia pachnodae]|uniref:Lipopolysaccharide cholinephosphotransferase n=1 Tax=Breznakia pachnodae TaxID=265178 RepID=A0ABU0DYY9_9FIRM|nr:LicD family protein [Breznakia pachnodae]MDQ0359786.1 lipopolysaccharide cholinephosphotransferase [Breznakia pachnodae]
MADYKYEDNTLKKLQEIELSILNDFSKICDENNLDYFLVGGSAIGVLRHKGFIPWDDDIDVGMSRKDYDKFLAIAKDQYSDRYTIVNNQERADFPLMNTRWGLNGTQFVPEDFKNVKGDFGIFLDIFCFDNIPDDDKEMRKQGTWAWFWGKLLVVSGVPKPVLYVYGIKAKIVLFVYFFAHRIFKILHLKPRLFYNKASKHMLKYKDVETKRMAYMFDPSRFTSIVNKADIYPTQKRKFENIEVRVPHKVEEYLATRYGDYMQLPPEDKRHNHPPYILDFGEFGDNDL